MGNVFGCVIVEESTVALKEKFGRFDEKILQPGCHCVPWCFGSEIAGRLYLKVQQLDVKCETKTKDNTFVTIAASVHYRALPDKAADAFYKLSNTREQIQDYICDAIRSTVLKLDLGDVFKQQDDIAKAVEKLLAEPMDEYGHAIVRTFIVDIQPDANVKFEMNNAARLRIAATQKAEAEKIMQIKRAEAEVVSKYISGVGIAAKRQVIFEGLKNVVVEFTESVPGTTPKEVMDMVLATHYLETMKEIGANTRSSAEFTPHGPRAVRDAVNRIRDGLFQGSSA